MKKQGEQSAGGGRPAGAYKKLRWAGVIALAILAGLAALLISKWPYSRRAMLQRLERASSANVEIQKFRSTYFPYPGCVAEDVVFRKAAPGNGPKAEQPEPLLAIHSLTIQSTFWGLFNKKIREIIADGVRMHLRQDQANSGKGEGNPGSGAAAEQKPHQDGKYHQDEKPHQDQKQDDIKIDELRVENATLEVSAGSGREPLVFQIHRATFRNLDHRNTVPFDVSLHMPLPPAEVQVGGWIGPAQDLRGNFRNTPISGFYNLQRADLDVFRALGGQVSSRGEFSGTLERLNVSGGTESPDFEVKASRHRFHLTTRFSGVLDLRSGDLVLPTFNARLGNTSLDGHARVAGRPKTVELNVVRGKGEIQDLMLLFSKAPRSPVTGPVSFHADALLPPEHRPFKERVQLRGDFIIDPAHFSSPNTQTHVDQLSERARGKKDKDKGDAPDEDAAGFESVITELRGRVVLKDGTARFSEISFSVPGAEADMNGTYNLVNKNVNLRGKMRMQATVSQATTGAKSFFLKMLDPMFKKKGAGAEVTVAMTGTYGHTRFKAGLK